MSARGRLQRGIAGLEWRLRAISAPSYASLFCPVGFLVFGWHGPGDGRQRATAIPSKATVHHCISTLVAVPSIFLARHWHEFCHKNSRTNKIFRSSHPRLALAPSVCQWCSLSYLLFGPSRYRNGIHSHSVY